MKNLIGYEWKEASNGATIEVVNPATQELVDTVPNVTLEDVGRAGLYLASDLSSGTTGQVLYCDCGCHCVYGSSEEMEIISTVLLIT